MQPDLQQRRTIRNTGKKQSLYIYSNTFQGGETQTHLRTAHNTQSTKKVIPATCWSKSHLHAFFTHRGYTVISLQLPHQPSTGLAHKQADFCRKHLGQFLQQNWYPEKRPHSPMFSGLNAATTSRRGQAFQ